MPPSPVVLVTGATSGLGEACARRLARDGARLVLLGRRADRLQALQHSLSVPTFALEVDVRDRAQVEAGLASLPPEFAALTVLVNNAGLALGMGPAHQADPEDWEAMVDTNIKGVLYCTRAVLPGMVQRGAGHIVNIGSVAGSWPYAGGNVYGGTKAFIQQFSRNLRSELLGTPVRVTCVEPGMVETEFSLVRFHGDTERAKSVYADMTPLSAEDMADTIQWCLSRPAHVNVNSVEIMPVDQAFGGLAVHRHRR